MASETLSEMQLAFMRALWTLKEGSVSQVQGHLEREGYTFAPTTVATVLRRLETRGLVDHREEGRTFVYHATQSQRQLSKSLVSSLADSLFGGRVGSLLCHLVDSEEVSSADLAAIKAVIAAKERHHSEQSGGEEP